MYGKEACSEEAHHCVPSHCTSIALYCVEFVKVVAPLMFTVDDKVIVPIPVLQMRYFCPG
jgi:hypothetical protein